MSLTQQQQMMGAHRLSYNRSISPEERQNMMSAQWQRQRIMKARKQQMQSLIFKQQERSQGQPSLVGVMGTAPGPGELQGARWYELPFEEPSDLHWLSGEKPEYIISLEKACQTGSVPDIQAVISSNHLSTIKLYRALLITLNAGHIDASAYLLEHGARIVGSTARNILSGPIASQVPLFELLIQHGWDINKAEEAEDLLLPHSSIITSHSLLEWFLAHGANPNVGWRTAEPTRNTGLHDNYCAALECAARKGSIEAVQMLLDAGACVSNGTPLHSAAGALPPGSNPHNGRVAPSEEFDIGMIPIMEILVNAGADVNQRIETCHMTPVYAINHAVMAGAVERVKWLLKHGANPRLRGAWGTAVDYVMAMGSDEMKLVFTNWIEDREGTQTT
ncbi:ankyrin repeat-containing domain protein [Penicillium herquei]|nr:ankyrin repeat-containing domain protein [Penicillium herquei]